MKFTLLGVDDLIETEQAEVSDVVTRILNAIELDEYEINVSLIDKIAMENLYLRFKKKKKVTDVLSFPTPEMEKIFLHSKDFLGDVVICTDQARKQAKKFGHHFSDEIAVLCAHGLFHLLGYDHEESEEEANIQLQGEMYILEKAGFAPELSLIGRA